MRSARIRCGEFNHRRREHWLLKDRMQDRRRQDVQGRCRDLEPATIHRRTSMKLFEIIERGSEQFRLFLVFGHIAIVTGMNIPVN
jgi:hypothetical protein